MERREETWKLAYSSKHDILAAFGLAWTYNLDESAESNLGNVKHNPFSSLLAID